VRSTSSVTELEEALMSIVGGVDIHRKQLTFDYVDRATGGLVRGQIAPADRRHLAVWLRRFDGVGDVAFAVEGCTGWRYVVEELHTAGVRAYLAEPADTAAARGRKKRAKTDRADAKLLRELLDGDRLPQCWIPPGQVLEYRALLGLYHDLRREHTGWVQRIHAVLFHHGAQALGDGGISTTDGRIRLGQVAAEQLSPAGRCRWPPRWRCWRSWRSTWRTCADGWCTPRSIYTARKR
jgi:hypothetical protein